MVAVERAVSRGARRGRRACLDLEEEFRLARLAAGWSQDRVARAAGISRSHFKRRDDPVDRFVLLVADTKTNRRVLAASPTLFTDLPRLAPEALRRHLAAGDHPPTCLVVV